jgi:hypothetical protein
MSKIKKVILIIAALLLLPALYLYLMFDVRMGDPVKGRTVRHCKHVATAHGMFTDMFTNMNVIVTEKAEDLDGVSKEVIMALTGKHQAANPYGTSFMEDPSPGMKNPGHFPDAWGNQYLIRIDDDGDGSIPMGNRSVKAGVIVWSRGPDGINDWGRKDDIFFKQ